MIEDLKSFAMLKIIASDVIDYAEKTIEFTEKFLCDNAKADKIQQNFLYLEKTDSRDKYIAVIKLLKKHINVEDRRIETLVEVNETILDNIFALEYWPCLYNGVN